MSDAPGKEDRPIKVWSYFKPALPGGAYTIEVEQKLRLADAPIPPLKQNLYIDAPRFVLDPKDIHSVYPARESTGGFADEIPFVVLTRRTLPWERPMSSTQSDPTIPWLALLVFTSGQVSETYTTTIRQYLEANSSRTDTIVPLKGQISQEEKGYLDEQRHCRYIELSLDLFHTLVPDLEALPLLAHVRKVDMTNKADMEMPDQGAFSIVMANRLPSPGKDHVVHLVSVEGCQGLLQNREKNGNPMVRLISLASWSFKCADSGGRFRDTVRRLVETDGEHLRLALACDAKMEKNVQRRLKNGYVPLPYHFTTGEHNLAWYRGPAIPAPEYTEVMGPAEEPFFSASAAMRFDRRTGLFDQSYAAAWQLGRSLALADATFGPQLMGLRRKAHQVWDEFCDHLFFQSSDQPIIDMDTLVQGAKKLAQGPPDMEQVAAYLDEKLDGLIDEIDRAAEKMDAGTSDPLQVTDFLRMGFSEQRADAMGADTPSGMFGLVNHIVSHVVIALKKNHLVGHLKDRVDIMGSLFRLALSKMIDRVSDKVLKSHLLQELEAVYQWMDHLSLTDVPFRYLVAHPNLVPLESIRFFYMDASWWHALFDGAASLGIHSSIDEALYRVMRKRFLERWTEKNFKDKHHPWGLFLRSDLVRIWSGVELCAYDDQKPVLPLLTKKIGDDLLLFLYEHAPHKLELREPKEGLRFSVDPLKDREALRLKNEALRVLDVAAIKQEGELADSAQWARRLIRQPERLIFEAAL